nr:DUF2637 domain-containing protein [Planobispora longispora]
MAWAVAVCIDLTCVMAARERQRDKKTGRVRSGPISWPTLVLAAGIMLSLAANLAQAEPSVWGWICAATPAGAFLIAVSMLERRASAPHPEPSPTPIPDSAPEAAGGPAEIPALVPAVENALAGPAAELVDYARRVADDYHATHGQPITRDTLRARLGVSHQLATDLLNALHTA